MVMTSQMERHLIQLGVIPPTEIDELEQVVDPRAIYFTKGYFDDPRDPVTGEVNH